MPKPTLELFQRLISRSVVQSSIRVMERGIFRYLKWQELYKVEKPFQVLIDLPEDAELKRQTNMEFEDGSEMTITDIRAVQSRPQIDTHGFTYAYHDSSLTEDQFLDKVNVESIYLPECEALLRSSLDGVDEIHFFNWLVLSIQKFLLVDISLLTHAGTRYQFCSIGQGGRFEQSFGPGWTCKSRSYW